MLELVSPLHAFDLAEIKGGHSRAYGRRGEKLYAGWPGNHLRADTLVMRPRTPLAIGWHHGGDIVAQRRTQDLSSKALSTQSLIAGKARGY